MNILFVLDTSRFKFRWSSFMDRCGSIRAFFELGGIIHFWFHFSFEIYVDLWCEMKGMTSLVSYIPEHEIAISSSRTLYMFFKIFYNIF